MRIFILLVALACAGYYALPRILGNTGAEQVGIDVAQSPHNDRSSPSFGSPDPDVTIYAFFDYNCGYCKRSYQDLSLILQHDKRVQLVMKDHAVLGPSSRVGAQYALAAARQGKYWDFHSAMMESRAPITAQSLESLGQGLGMDVDRLRTDAASAEIRHMIDNNAALAGSLGMSGVPGFVIGGRVYGGYSGPQGMSQAIANARRAQVR